VVTSQAVTSAASVPVGPIFMSVGLMFVSPETEACAAEVGTAAAVTAGAGIGAVLTRLAIPM
jgi:hypothetical protein